MKAIISAASLIVLIGGLQGCASLNSHPHHYVKSNTNPYGYYENYGNNCCKQTDYYFYSNYSEPYYYHEISLSPVDGCTYQPTDRYFYHAPAYYRHYCGMKHHKHHYRHHRKHR